MLGARSDICKAEMAVAKVEIRACAMATLRARIRQIDASEGP